MARRRKKKKSRSGLILTVLILLLIFYTYKLITQIPLVAQTVDFSKGRVSAQVQMLQPQVEERAAYYGISEYVPYLLAIMEVESGGEGKDVMQASESLDLPPNSLGTEESIDQGVNYFAHLLNRAEEEGCDVRSAIQAYNYGSGFIDYVSVRGGRYSDQLAESFAAEQSNGEQVRYFNLLSIRENGGWRYNYGNMFYTRLVERFL